MSMTFFNDVHIFHSPGDGNIQGVDIEFIGIERFVGLVFAS